MRISKSPDVMRRDDKSSRGYSGDSRSPRVPERERRLSEHQMPGEKREEERRLPDRRENHPSGSSGASKRSIESESPGEKRLRRDDQAAREENIQTDILNTIRRWFKGPISVDIQIKPGSPEGGEEDISLNLNINNKNNNKSTVIDGESESSFDKDKKLYREKIDLNKIKVEARNQEDSPPKDAKGVKKRQKFDYEEDQKIVNMVLDKLDDNLLYSFDIPGQGLVKLSSELNREGKHIQSRWRYSIRLWIKEDQENKKDDWYNHGQAALDRRIQITRYFKIQTEMKRPKTVDKGQ